MSSLPRVGIARKSSVVLLGATLVGSFLLTACSSAATTAPSADSSSAQPSSTAAPTVSNETPLTVIFNEYNLFLSSGVVGFGKGDGDKTVLTYTPYENSSGEWKYTSDVILDKGGKINLMRWKDKSYVVLHGTNVNIEPALGLQAEKQTRMELIVVLDPETGKVVNTIKGDATTITGGLITGNPRPLSLINDELVKDPKKEIAHPPAGLSDEQPFMNGLVFGDGETTNLVDPLTGKIIATDTNHTQRVNDSGFYKVSEVFPAKNFGYEGTNLEAVFGNYLLVRNDKPRTSNSAPVISEYRLVNSVTKEVSPPSECIAADTLKNLSVGVNYSPDFRYVNFYGTTVFDTKTGKSFCSKPANQPDIRPFVVSYVDNNGNMYGVAGSDTLKVNINDTSKTAKWEVSDPGALDAVITDKGSLLSKGSKVATGSPDESKQFLHIFPAK
jgi:hypothetical protein